MKYENEFLYIIFCEQIFIEESEKESESDEIKVNERGIYINFTHFSFM